jgi:predicted Zn-dependent peptidase
MNRRARKVLICIFSVLLLGYFPPGMGNCQDDELLKNPREMTFPPLSFNPPKAERSVLSNGMVVYLLENPELPLIRVSALIRTGSVFDPPGLSGLAEMTARVLRNGGTLFQTPQTINQTLEMMGAQVEFSMEMEWGSASLFARKQDFPRVLSIFADLLINPGFDPPQVDLAKKAALEAIRRSNDNPEEIAYREFRRVLYRGNPRGEVPTLESIEQIQRGDLIAFYRKFFQPNNIFLGISGDFKKKEMIESLEKALSGWSRALVELPFIPLPSPQEGKSIYYASKDLPQSTILLGHLSLPLGHPDYFPFQVLNFILGGGGFNSRLTQEIRSNQGLAYAVGSFYRGRVGYGVFGTFCQTKSKSTHRVISLLYEIIEGMKKNPPGSEALDWAKNALINQFIFSFTSSAEVAQQQMKLEYDGLPDDYLEKYQERVSAVTLEDLGRAARDHLHPEKSILMVVGKGEDFDRPLSSFGAVQQIELKKYP